MSELTSAAFKMPADLSPLIQVQHIVTETRDKIMQYKSKMADEADLRRRLASLEESVELHEHMKRQVIHCCWGTAGMLVFCFPFYESKVTFKMK